MVSKTKTLERLNKEKEYEDELVIKLHDYCLNCLPDIPDLTETQKRMAEKQIETIQSESRKHSYMFNQLVQMVFESDEETQF